MPTGLAFVANLWAFHLTAFVLTSADINLDSFVSLVSSSSPAVILSVFIFALYKRMLVFGWQYDMMKKERDEALQIARDSVAVSGRSVTATEHVTNLAKPHGGGG